MKGQFSLTVDWLENNMGHDTKGYDEEWSS